LVPDLISSSREAELLSEYTEGRVRIIGGLWFHLSVYFNMELPLEWFEPSRQRASRDEELSSAAIKGASSGKSKAASSITGCIKRLLMAFLTHQIPIVSKENQIDWLSNHRATFESINQAREARRQLAEMHRAKNTESRKVGEKVSKADAEVEEGEIFETEPVVVEGETAQKRAKTEAETEQQEVAAEATSVNDTK